MKKLFFLFPVIVFLSACSSNPQNEVSSNDTPQKVTSQTWIDMRLEDMCSNKLANDPLYSDPDPELNQMIVTFAKSTEKHCRDWDNYSAEDKFELLEKYDNALSSFIKLKSHMELGRALGYEK